MAVNRIYGATGTTGGGTGALDSIKVADLADKDMAIVMDQTNAYFYVWDDDNASAESGVRIIDPDDNTGNGRWILQSIYVEDVTLVVDDLTVGDDLTVTGDSEFKGAVQIGDADGTGSNLTIYSDTAGDHMVFSKTGKTFTLTDIQLVANSVDINGGAIDGTTIGAAATSTIIGTTIDATTDFTIGSTIITDGVITDATGLKIAAALVNGADGAGDDWTWYSDTAGDSVVFSAGGNTVTFTDTQLIANNVDINGGTIDGAAIGGASAAAGTFTTITGSGVLSIDDTTETSSGVTGSIHTDGGLGVAKDVYVGDDLFMGSSGSVINWNSGDVTLTHAAGKLTVGGDGTVEIDFANHEMTNVDIDSGAIDGTTIGAGTAAAGTFTTCDATTDFTIGSTVITDGVITDASGFQITGGTITLSGSGETLATFTDDGACSLYYNNTAALSTISTGGQVAGFADSYLYVGNPDADRGYLILGSDNTGAGDGGGQIYLYNAEDYDTNNEFYQIGVIDEDFKIVDDVGNGLYFFNVSGTNMEAHVYFTSTTGLLRVNTPPGEAARLSVGTDHSSEGIVGIYGDAANTPGTLYLFNGATADTTCDYFSIAAGAGDTSGAPQMGPDTNPNQLIFYNDGSLLFADSHILPYVDSTYQLGADWGTDYCWSDVYADAGVTACTCWAKLKVHEPEDLGLEFINSLRPVKYKYKTKEKPNSPFNEEGTKLHGFLYDDLTAIRDELKIDKKEFAGIRENGNVSLVQFVAPLVMAVQELSAKLDSIENRLAALEGV